jgi:hypothetical protein
MVAESLETAMIVGPSNPPGISSSPKRGFPEGLHAASNALLIANARDVHRKKLFIAKASY